MHDWSPFNVISRLANEQGWASVHASASFSSLLLADGMLDDCRHALRAQNEYQRLEFRRRARRFAMCEEDDGSKLAAPGT